VSRWRAGSVGSERVDQCVRASAHARDEARRRAIGRDEGGSEASLSLRELERRETTATMKQQRSYCFIVVIAVR